MQFFRHTLLTATTGLMIAGTLTQPALAADTYKIDSVHSHVIFKIKHLDVGYQYGRFNKMTGTVMVDEKNPAMSSVNLTIDANSVYTGHPKRDAHLRSPDFFDVKQFPTITFKSTQITKMGKDYKVTGHLTMHGVKKPLTVILKKTGEGPGMGQGEWRMGGEAAFAVKRSDFGITYMPKGLSDKVTLMVSFEGVKQK